MGFHRSSIPYVLDLAGEFMTPYIIADTTYNHEGDIQYLYRMVDELADIKVDAVKFHLLFNIDGYMARTHPAYEKIKKMLIPSEQWYNIIHYAKLKGLDVVLLCDDIASIKYAMKQDINEVELHSSAITDTKLLSEAAKYDMRMMLGVGGATFPEIREALDFFDESISMTLMYGFNGWSTIPWDIQLCRMQKISKGFGLPVGYADHTNWCHPINTVVSCAAAFNGFPLLEKHYTCDPGVERVDYKESVGKEQMREIRRLMMLASEIYGDGSMSEAEKGFAEKIRKVDGKRR